MGAASVGPSEYGRNGRYVFAEPARDLVENLAGYEEVVRILHGPPLRAFRPRALDRR